MITLGTWLPFQLIAPVLLRGQHINGPVAWIGQTEWWSKNDPAREPIPCALVLPTRQTQSLLKPPSDVQLPHTFTDVAFEVRLRGCRWKGQAITTSQIFHRYQPAWSDPKYDQVPNINWIRSLFETGMWASL